LILDRSGCGRAQTTRPALFRHLGLEAAIASLDLARGTCGLSNEQYFAVYQVIGQLAWAVEIEVQQIEGTFLNVEASVVLPRRQRRYVCPLCWQQALRDGRAPIIRKEWILRMSWRCQVHALPLCALPVADGAMSEQAVGSWLSGAVARAESLRWKLGAHPRLVEWNAEGVDTLVRASRKRFKGRRKPMWIAFRRTCFTSHTIGSRCWHWRTAGWARRRGDSSDWWRWNCPGVQGESDDTAAAETATASLAHQQGQSTAG
jgi:hypothetical protein